MKASLTFIVSCMLFSLPVQAEEIVKWVDEEGKVHFGSRVPDKYKNQAEKVDVSKQNVVENENREKNTQTTNRIARENAKRARENEEPAISNSYNAPREKAAKKDMRIGGCDAAPSKAIKLKCQRSKPAFR